jgi:hypothetical protein
MASSPNAETIHLAPGVAQLAAASLPFRRTRQQSLDSDARPILWYGTVRVQTGSVALRADESAAESPFSSSDALRHASMRAELNTGKIGKVALIAAQRLS